MILPFTTEEIEILKHNALNRIFKPILQGEFIRRRAAKTRIQTISQEKAKSVLLFAVILEPNRMLFCEQYCNIAMECYNVDVQVARRNLQSL